MFDSLDQSEYDNDLVRQAFICIKSKEYDTARRYLERALETADDWDTRVRANYYMSLICDDPAEKRKYLEETLAIEPTHPEARRALAILDGKLKPDQIVDADNLPAASTGTQTAQADRFTCPKCGGRMVYTPDGRSLICESCSRQQVLSGNAPQKEQDFFLAMATGKGQRKPVAMRTFHCQGCGAQFLLPPQVISETCSYCGSVHVVRETHDLIEPDTIVPMALDQQKAEAQLAKWGEKHRIKPQEKVPPPRGFYLPLWSFDIMGEIPWKGRIYRNKRYQDISGDQSVAFNDISVPATSKLADMLPKLAADFDLSQAPAYDERYLAGWPAEVYQRPMADASLDARATAVERIRKTIYASFGNVEDLSYTSTNIFVSSFKMTLVPLWLTTYRFEDHDYRIVVNGQNGRVHGETSAHGILGFIGNLLNP